MQIFYKDKAICTHLVNPPTKVSDGVEKLGLGYAAYHSVRIAETTDAIAELITRVAGFDENSDSFSFIFEVTRAWRAVTYDAEMADGKKGEIEFLDAFDIRLSIAAPRVRHQPDRTAFM